MSMTLKRHLKTLGFTAGIFCLIGGGAAFAATVGEKVNNLEIKDAEDKPAQIPFLGEKVLAVIYTDCDEADLNDPLADALKAKNFPSDKYQGIGIANMKDSKAPNFLIRKIVRGKIEKYKTTILTDPDLIVATGWKLGDCNNNSVAMIIDKDMTVKYLAKGPVRGDSIDKVVKLVEELLK